MCGKTFQVANILSIMCAKILAFQSIAPPSNASPKHTEPKKKKPAESSALTIFSMTLVHVQTRGGCTKTPLTRHSSQLARSPSNWHPIVHCGPPKTSRIYFQKSPSSTSPGAVVPLDPFICRVIVDSEVHISITCLPPASGRDFNHLECYETH